MGGEVIPVFGKVVTLLAIFVIFSEVTVPFAGLLGGEDLAAVRFAAFEGHGGHWLRLRKTRMMLR